MRAWIEDLTDAKIRNAFQIYLLVCLQWQEQIFQELKPYQFMQKMKQMLIQGRISETIIPEPEVFDFSAIPEYNGDAWIVIGDNTLDFGSCFKHPQRREL